MLIVMAGYSASKSMNKMGFLRLPPQGYSPRDHMAEGIAAARHLLETVYRRPVIVKPLGAMRLKLVSEKLEAFESLPSAPAIR